MSVCIVHRDGWAVCDSKETAGTMIFPSSMKKVVKSDGYLIAGVGHSGFIQGASKLAKNKGHEVDLLDTLLETMEEKEYEATALVCTYKRELIHIDCTGAATELTTDFWAIGCAEWYVLGRLHLIAETRPVTVEDAKAAIVAAAKYDNGIDDRVQEFWLDRV